MNCFWLVALFVWLVGCATPRTAPQLDCKAIARVTATMLAGHVYYTRTDAALRSRVAESYRDLLDPERILFAPAQPQIEQIVDQVARGNCAGLHALETDVENRLVAMARVAEARGTDGSEPPGEVDQRRARSLDSWRSIYRAIDADSAGPLVVAHYERVARRFADRDAEDAYATYLSAFARALDRDSSYLAPKIIQDFEESMRSNLAGIGLALSERHGVTVVERILPRGSADREGGIQVGDHIVGVGEGRREPRYVTGMPLADVVRLIRGRADTEVTLQVLTPGGPQARRVTLTRRAVALDSERAHLRFQVVERGEHRFEFAILTLPSFYSDPASHDSSRDVGDLLFEIDKKRAAGVVVDLRDNGGGLLDEAVEIAGFFIAGGPIGMTRDRTGTRRVLGDPDPRIHCATPMVVLTSSRTAAAAELFAGAMKDHRRALVVGDERTLGRGTLQRVHPMRSGAVKLTTATLHTPSGQSLEGNAVVSAITLKPVGDRDPEPDRRFSLPDEALIAVPAESTSSHGFAAIDRVAVELSRRSEQRVGENQLTQSAEILADYLAMGAR